MGKIAVAANLILKSRENQNPYSTDHHKEGCPEVIWDGVSDPPELIGEKEVADRHCAVCSYERKLWAAILKHTSSVECGDLALRGFRVLAKVEQYHYPVVELDDFDYVLMDTVSVEVKKREAYRTWKAMKEAEES